MKDYKFKKEFIGTINGNTFHTVEDYNRELTRLINEGVTEIQAQSSTNLVRDFRDNKTIDLTGLPGFQSTEEYEFQDLIKFIDQTAAVDQINTDDSHSWILDDDIYNKFDKIFTSLSDYKPNDLEDIKQKISGVCNDLVSYKYNANNKCKVADELLDIYQGLLFVLTDIINNDNIKCDDNGNCQYKDNCDCGCDCGCGDNCKCKCGDNCECECKSKGKDFSKITDIWDFLNYITK